MSTDSLFRSTALRIAQALRKDVPLWSVDDISACIGNAAHECNGFHTLQETSPTVAGSRGGLGYFQWTGPRRRAFEAWCAKRGFSTSSFEGNYGFLLYELNTSERGAVGATRSGKTLADKVRKFEMGFERAGVKHYASREAWAEKARELLGPNDPEHPAVEALKPKPPHASMATSKIGNASIGGALATAAGAKVVIDQAQDAKDTAQSAGALLGLSGSAALSLGVAVIVIVFFAYIWWQRRNKLNKDGV